MYLARDTKHGRDVAVKVIRPELRQSEVPRASATGWAVDDGRQQAGAARRSLGTARPAKSGHETQEVVLRRLGLRHLTDDSTGSQNQDAL